MSQQPTHRNVSDVIAATLFENGITQIFGITGAGNIQIFDALARHGGFQLTFTHHEQAAVMAANTYYRTSGKVALALVTTGGGSTNAITGAVSSNMDSVPVLIIAGNEPSRYSHKDNSLRIWGIQGFDSVAVMSPVVKRATRLIELPEISCEVSRAILECKAGRPGVIWLEVPLDIQSLKVLSQDSYFESTPTSNSDPVLQLQITAVVNALRQAKRPLLWLGYGVKAAHAKQLAEILIEQLPVPFLLSWAASDLIENSHPRYVGKAGVYGQRAANLILQGSDYVLAIGTRLAIPQIGYSLEELAPSARIDYVDIDTTEAFKHGARITEAIVADAGEFIEKLLTELKQTEIQPPTTWLDHIAKVKEKFPLFDVEHQDTLGFMNSYRVIERLQKLFRDDAIITTDMGTALLSGFYGLEIKKNQQLLTSTGLGEMGFGLPAAVGAAFANPTKEIICLNADGGMMMNLQELQTIVHHNLNVKIFIFNNDGYLMIKRSQIALLEGRFVGVDKSSGLSCPQFSKVADAFGIPHFELNEWYDFNDQFDDFFSRSGPTICEIKMDPKQTFLPRLLTITSPNGSLVSPPLEDLSPLLSIEDLEWALQRKASPRSYELRGLIG